MGANYSFYVKTIETHARAFLTLNILAIGNVLTHKKYQSLLKTFLDYFLTILNRILTVKQKQESKGAIFNSFS